MKSEIYKFGNKSLEFSKPKYMFFLLLTDGLGRSITLIRTIDIIRNVRKAALVRRTVSGSVYPIEC